MEAHDILEEFETNLVPRVVADSSLIGFRLRSLRHRRRAHEAWEKLSGRGKAGEENNDMKQTASSLRGLGGRIGYAGTDPEYASLNKSISDLEKQVKGNSGTGPAFSRLIDKVTAFFHRQSDCKKPA